jgi:uncharacterized protein with FMN-binding domain
MAQGGPNKKVANSLVAVSTAAVLAVYAAGYARTRSAADKLDAQSAERRPIAPVPANAAPGTDTLANAATDYDWARDQGSVPTQIAQPKRAPVAASNPMEVASPPPAANEKPAARVPEPKTEVATVAPVTNAPAAPIVTSVASVTVATPAAVAPVPVVPAPDATTATAPAAPAAPKYKDGTYTGWGTCRHGDIQAEVVIEGGRIISANIAQCLTRYSCNVIGRLPPEVPQRQSAEVDYVSGATQSTNAYYYAVLEALGKAK